MCFRYGRERTESWRSRVVKIDVACSLSYAAGQGFAICTGHFDISFLKAFAGKLNYECRMSNVEGQDSRTVPMEIYRQGHSSHRSGGYQPSFMPRRLSRYQFEDLPKKRSLDKHL